MTTGIIFDIKHYAIHDGPGIRTSVFMKGCPLRCKWCHNPEGISLKPEVVLREEKCKSYGDCVKVCEPNAIVLKDGVKSVDRSICNLCGDCVEDCATGALDFIGREMTVEQVMAAVEKDIPFFEESGGGVTFTGGEPMLQVDFLAEILRKCKIRGLHTTVDTSGFCKYPEFEKITEYVDLFLYDIKTLNDELHKEITGVSNKLILENLEKLVLAGNRVGVRLPFVPGVNDSKEQVKETIDYLTLLNKKSNPTDPMDPIEAVSLLPYHKYGVSKAESLKITGVDLEEYSAENSRIDDIRDQFTEYGFEVRIGG